MHMYAFYAVRGYTLEYLNTLSFSERVFLRCAMETYYEDEAEKYRSIFGTKGV